MSTGPLAGSIQTSLGVTLAGIAYAAPAQNAGDLLWHAMVYEAAVFALAAACAAGLAGSASREARTGLRPAVC